MKKTFMTLMFLFLLMFFGCKTSAEIELDIPDNLSATVQDFDTGQGLGDVFVSVLINEKYFVSFLGPEGMTRPKIRESKEVKTTEDGKFFLDLKKMKLDLSARYPSTKLIMSGIYIRKVGYVSIARPYTNSAQIFRLKKQQ